MSGTGGDNLDVDKTLFVVGAEPTVLTTSETASETEAQLEPTPDVVDDEERIPFASEWTPSRRTLPLPVYAGIVFAVVAACITVVFTVSGDDDPTAAASDNDEAITATEQDDDDDNSPSNVPAAPTTETDESEEPGDTTDSTLDDNSEDASTTSTTTNTDSENNSTETNAEATTQTTRPENPIQIVIPNTAPTPTLPVPSEILTTTTRRPTTTTQPTTTQRPTTTAQPTTSAAPTTTIQTTTTTTQPTTTAEPTTTTPPPLAIARTELRFEDTFLVAVYTVPAEQFCFASWSYTLRDSNGAQIANRSQTLPTDSCTIWHGVPVETRGLPSGETYTIDLTATSDQGRQATILDEVTIA